MPLKVSNADWIWLFFNPQCFAHDCQRVAHVQLAHKVDVKFRAGVSNSDAVGQAAR